MQRELGELSPEQYTALLQAAIGDERAAAGDDAIRESAVQADDLMPGMAQAKGVWGALKASKVMPMLAGVGILPGNTKNIFGSAVNPLRSKIISWVSENAGRPVRNAMYKDWMENFSAAGAGLGKEAEIALRKRAIKKLAAKDAKFSNRTLNPWVKLYRSDHGVDDVFSGARNKPGATASFSPNSLATVGTTTLEAEAPLDTIMDLPTLMGKRRMRGFAGEQELVAPWSALRNVREYAEVPYPLDFDAPKTHVERLKKELKRKREPLKFALQMAEPSTDQPNAAFVRINPGWNLDHFKDAYMKDSYAPDWKIVDPAKVEVIPPTVSRWTAPEFNPNTGEIPMSQKEIEMAKKSWLGKANGGLSPTEMKNINAVNTFLDAHPFLKGD